MSNVSKHKMTFLSLTKSLTVVAFMLIFYPFILTVQSAFCQNKPVDEALTNLVLLVIIASGMLGYFCGKIESRIHAKTPDKKASNRMLTRVFIFCFVVIPIVVLTLILPDLISGYFIAGTVAMCITAFTFGFVFWYKEYSVIIEKRAVVTYAVVNIVAIIALFFLKATYSQNFIVIYYFIFIALYFVTRNQSNIDYLMERRQHKLEHLPKKIRYYNLYLILAILAVILTAFLAKKPIAKLFMIIIDYAKKLIKAVIDFINWLMNLFAKEGTSQMGEVPSDNQMMPAGGGTSGFDWTYIIITLLVAGVIFIIVKNRKAIYRFFARMFNKILSAIKKLLLNTPLSLSKGDESSDYYQDEAQSLDKNDIVANRKKKEFTHRDFKKQCKIYLNMTDNEEKLLFGYQLMVRWFEVKGVDIIKSDTAIEILHKVRDKKMSEKDRLEIVTDFYNYIRFKKVKFSNQSLTELTNILFEMTKRNS